MAATLEDGTRLRPIELPLEPEALLAGALLVLRVQALVHIRF